MVNADFTSASGRAYLPLTTVHHVLFARAIAAGWGSEDNSAVIKVYQEQAP